MLCVRVCACACAYACASACACAGGEEGECIEWWDRRMKQGSVGGGDGVDDTSW